MTYPRVVDTPSPLGADSTTYQVGLTAPVSRRSVNGTYRKEERDVGDGQLREAQGAGRKGG